MPIGRTVLEGKPSFAAGQRDRYLTIQQLTEGSGATGYPVDTWTTLSNVWASRVDLTADERYVAGQESGFSQTRWHLEYREDMDPELVDVVKTRRLFYQGRVYDIRTAVPVGHGLHRAIELVTLVKADQAAA